MSRRTVCGFVNVDAMNFATCPECYQPPGRTCLTDLAIVLETPHRERVARYQKQFPDRKKLYAEDWRFTRSAVAEYNRKMREGKTAKPKKA